MRRPLRFLLFLGALAAAAAAAALVRRRLATPVPLGPTAPPARDEETAAPTPPTTPEPPAARPAAAPAPDDLAEVRGIGPIYHSRLAEAGITTLAALAVAAPGAVAAAAGVPEERAAGWIAQAAALGSR
jgi:predicted flap endonuclease-1-like 5' DNA nuclease